MRPIDLTSGKPWSDANTNAKLREFKTEAVRQLQARDVSRGLPPDGRKYQEIARDPEDPDRLPKIVEFDPTLMSIKGYTGRELMLLIKHWWADFVSQPRDETSYATTTTSTARAAALESAKAAAADVEASLAPRKSPKAKTAGNGSLIAAKVERVA